MIDLGTVKPGSTIRIPFSSFDKDDGSSITMTNYAAADILIYKDGGTTERASTAGFTATTDFDSKTGKHVAVIDLADNTTSGFFNAGSEYLVAIDSVTVDTVTTGAWIARFRIGYPNAVLDTTIASLTNQTSFTLTAGPAEDDALNGFWAVIHDIASAVQCSWVEVLDYTGSTKTVTLAAGATFTAAAGDNISLMGPSPLRAATTGRTAAVGTAGQIDANVTQNGGTNITATGGRQEVNLSHWRGTQPATLADTDKVPASVQHMANNVMTAAAAAADLTTELQSGLATSANQTTILNRIGTPSDLGGGASLSANLSDIEAQTDDIGVAGAGLTAVPWNAAWDAEVQSEVADALDAAIPGSPTANSINERIQTMDNAYTATRAGYLDNVNNAALATTAAQTGDSYARIGAPAGASLAADVAAVKSDTAAILDDTGTSGVVIDPASKTGMRMSAQGVDDFLDEVVLGSYTLRQLLRGIAAASIGKLSGAATTTVTIRSADDTKDVVIATVDADGNRSAITLDLT